MNRTVLFFAAIALVVVTIALAVFYLIPGIYHPYFSLHASSFGFVDASKHQAIVKSAHRVYSVGFFVLAVIFGVLAFLFRPRRALASQAR